MTAAAFAVIGASIFVTSFIAGVHGIAPPLASLMVTSTVGTYPPSR